MKECNNCARFNCDIIRSLYPKFRENHKVSRTFMRLSCPNNIKPRTTWKLSDLISSVRIINPNNSTISFFVDWAKGGMA